MLAKSVNVQLRTENFEDFSHQKQLDFRTASTKEIFAKAKEILNEMHEKSTFIRLVGVRVDGLVPKNEVQMSLFDTNNDEKQEKLDKTIDVLKEKFGYDFITRAGDMNINKDIGIGKK